MITYTIMSNAVLLSFRDKKEIEDWVKWATNYGPFKMKERQVVDLSAKKEEEEESPWNGNDVGEGAA